MKYPNSQVKSSKKPELPISLIAIRIFAVGAAISGFIMTIMVLAR